MGLQGGILKYFSLLGVAVAVKGASVPVTPPTGEEYVTLGNSLAGVLWKYDSQSQTGGVPADWGTQETVTGIVDWPDCAGTVQSPIDVEVNKLESPKDDVGKVVNHLYELDITGDLINTGRHITYQIREGLRPYISGGPLDSK